MKENTLSELQKELETAAEEMQEASGLKPGDKVKISRTAASGEGWDNEWLIEMDDCIGKVGTIAGINGDAGIIVVMKDSKLMYGFPYFVLEKVENDLPETKNLTAQAADACIAIFENYARWEVLRAGKPIRAAWEIGEQLSAARVVKKCPTP